MEELDFSGLLIYYSDKGGTGFSPIMLHTVVTYANMCGVRAVCRIVDLCQRDLAFIWLTKGQKPQKDIFYGFKGKKLAGEALNKLNYQFIRRLEKGGLISLKEPYIDGTRTKASASRYTFIRRGSLDYYLAGLLDTIDVLCTKYDTFLLENGYNPEYNPGSAWMFMIEGVGKVRRVIRESREWELTKHRKISNNTIIEIDYCSPLEVRKLQKDLIQIVRGEGTGLVYEKGKHKPKIRKLYEGLEKCRTRLMEYKKCFKIMGKSRNSYSETDIEATFMWMKEDHILNGQLKPAYNVQIAVKNYFTIHGYVSSDRTDYHTLIPILGKRRKTFGNMSEAVTADSSYRSEKNLLYLGENRIRSYIKLQEHEKCKTWAYKEDIGKYYTMTYAVFEGERCYICHDGKELWYIRTESKKQDGYTQTMEVYGCVDCDGYEHKPKCLYRYNAEKGPGRNKVTRIGERWEELRGESHTDIQSEGGILKRQTRSIQTEGYFGDIKENENFRCFNYRLGEKVYKEFMLYAIGRNMIKYH